MSNNKYKILVVEDDNTIANLIQTILEMEPPLLEGWEPDSINMHYARKTESGMAVIFANTLTTSYIHIAEFDTDGSLLRLIEVDGLRYTSLDKCEIRELTLPQE